MAGKVFLSEWTNSDLHAAPDTEGLDPNQGKHRKMVINIAW